MSRNAELFDAMLKVAVGVLILAAWTYVVLDQRDLRRALRRQRTQLHQDRRAIIQLQGAAPAPPTSIGQPMPTVGRPQPKVTIGGVDMSRYVKSLDIQADPDPTLRLRRPPALSDIEALLTQAGRCLTPTELADHLERKPWDLLPELERLTTTGRIKLVPGHTAGQSAYTLADPTMRLSRMPVLPGVTP